MKSNTLHVLSLVGAGITASCGYTAPYQASGPAFSKEGVEISVAGDQCYVNRSAEEFPSSADDGVLHVGLRLQVANHSGQVAVISREAFQLAESVGNEHAVMHPEETGSFTLPPGGSADLALDFAQTQETALDCQHPMELDPRDAVAIEGRPASLASIRFQPAP